jgi:Ca-activated chloride channel family protein
MNRLSARSERQLISARGGSSRHVHLIYDAPKRPPGEQRLPMNLAFVIDRSGSMGGEKIVLARLGTIEGVSRLAPTDRFSIIAYDDHVDVCVPSTPGGAQGLARAKSAIRGIEPRGGTDLCAGWLNGCKQIAAGLSEGQVARALLFTDGLANHGITDAETLCKHAAELRARGIHTSTFGIGSDFDERLLRSIADAGGGQSRYVESPADLPRLLSEELTDAMDVVQRKVVLRVEGPSGVGIEVVGPWPTRRIETGVEVEIGDLVSEERLEMVVRIQTGHGPAGGSVGVRFTVLDGDDAAPPAQAECSWIWALSADNQGQSRVVEIDRVVAERHAARARERAILANRNRDYGEAGRLLRRVAKRIAEYSANDPILCQIVAELERDADTYGAAMSAESQKSAYNLSGTAYRSRTATGSARRR